MISDSGLLFWHVSSEGLQFWPYDYGHGLWLFI